MAMVNVVNWQPTGGLQANRLGPKVVSHLAPCSTHRVNQEESKQYEVDGMKKGADSTGKVMDI